MGDEKDFKVIDKRASSGVQDPAPSEPKAGEGFVMKEGTPAQEAPQGVDFPTFVFSLATGAFIQMGLAPDPMTGKTEKNLNLAKQNIDILVMIADKTKGNLSEDEKRMLDGLIAEARLRFVEVSKAK